MRSSAPVFAVNEFTTKPLNFERDLALYQKLGVTGIEVAENKLSTDVGEAREQLAQLDDAGLHITSVQPRVHSIFPNRMAEQPADPQERAEAIQRTIDFFSDVPCTVDAPLPLVTITGRAPDYDFRIAWKIAGDLYGELARYAADRGLRLAFETLHPVLMNVDTFICSLGDAVRLHEVVDHPNFGLVFDVWHLWPEPNLRQRAKALAERFFIAHFSDWPHGGPRHVDDRVIPGQGTLDLSELRRALQAAKYAGPYVLEILSDKNLPDSLWQADPAEVIEESRKYLAI